LLRWISVTIALVSPFLIWSQFSSSDNHGWQDAVTGTASPTIHTTNDVKIAVSSNEPPA